MCGICGFVGFDDDRLIRRTLSRVLCDGSDAERHLSWVGNFTPEQASALMLHDSNAMHPVKFVDDVPATAPADDARVAEHLDANVIREIAGAHFSGAAQHGQPLWNLVCLELSYRIFTDQRFCPPPAHEAADALTGVGE